MLLPAAAVKQKAKEGLVSLGRALFYPSVKRSPCAFGFCVRLDCAGCLRGKKRLLFLLVFKRKRIQGNENIKKILSKRELAFYYIIKNILNSI
jgi:hypothetical protein